MPICVEDKLPAVNVLRNENVFVMTNSRAAHQDIRPLKVLLLNLMPKKIETENQFLRLLSNSPLHIDVRLLRIDARESKNTPTEHLNNFYCYFNEIKEQNFDGLIVTGAPLGKVDFSDVVYWSEIEEIIHWAKEHVTSTLFVCWAVQAALNILYDIPKLTRQEKLSGIYAHKTKHSTAPIIRGFDDQFLAPHSRYADFPTDIIQSISELELFVESDKAGAYLFATKDRRLVFVTGHPEYDAETLSTEYFRDLAAGLSPDIPVNYFPENNPDNPPTVSWRSHGSLLFSNWLNYYVYQITPYDLKQMNPTLE